MKKFFILFLSFACAAGIFAPQSLEAQFIWRLNTDFNVRLASFMIPVGEKADKLINVGSYTRYNDTINNPTINNRGDYSYAASTLDLFNYGRTASTKFNEFNLILQFQSEYVQLHTRLLLDNLIRSTVAANTGAGANELAGTHSFVQGDGRSPNWGDFLRYSFDEWYVRGSYQFFSCSVGIVFDRGKVRYYNNFTYDLLSTVLVECLGVNTPTVGANYQNDGQDSNDFYRQSRINADDPYYRDSIPYLLLNFRVDKLFSFPLTFQVAADAGTNTFIGTVFNHKRISGGFRVSGENVGKRVTFDATYKIRGADINTLDNYEQNYYPDGFLQPNGDGISSHTFGLYANILNVPNFNFALGYSGYLRIFEDTLSKATGETTTKTGPLFSGFDLRVVYSGLKKTTMTLSNNISFAGVDASAGNAISVGVLGQNLPAGYAQSWFALYNTFGILYRLNSQVSASFQIGSRYGLITTDIASSVAASSIQRSHHRLAGGGFIAFQLTNFFRVQGGLGILYVNDLYSNSAAGSQNIASQRSANGGTLEITVPVRIYMTFRQ